MKIYIAGKVTGLNWHDAQTKFAISKQKLLDAGFYHSEIVNPMELGIPPETEWKEAMEVCLKNLEQCTAIYVQKDWRDSYGTRREMERAEKLKMERFFETEGEAPIKKRLKILGR